MKVLIFFVDDNDDDVVVVAAVAAVFGRRSFSPTKAKFEDAFQLHGMDALVPESTLPTVPCQDDAKQVTSTGATRSTRGRSKRIFDELIEQKQESRKLHESHKRARKSLNNIIALPVPDMNVRKSLRV